MAYTFELPLIYKCIYFEVNSAFVYTVIYFMHFFFTFYIYLLMAYCFLISISDTHLTLVLF